MEDNNYDFKSIVWQARVLTWHCFDQHTKAAIIQISWHRMPMMDDLTTLHAPIQIIFLGGPSILANQCSWEHWMSQMMVILITVRVIWFRSKYVCWVITIHTHARTHTHTHLHTHSFFSSDCVKRVDSFWWMFICNTLKYPAVSHQINKRHCYVPVMNYNQAAQCGLSVYVLNSNVYWCLLNYTLICVFVRWSIPPWNTHFIFNAPLVIASTVNSLIEFALERSTLIVQQIDPISWIRVNGVTVSIVD